MHICIHIYNLPSPGPRRLRAQLLRVRGAGAGQRHRADLLHGRVSLYINMFVARMCHNSPPQFPGLPVHHLRLGRADRHRPEPRGPGRPHEHRVPQGDQLWQLSQ